MSFTDMQSLRPLLGKSELLHERNGKIFAVDKLPVPVNEFGLPEREQLIRDVLATVATGHIWTGSYDIHHLAWHGEKFRRIQTKSHPKLGANFRGASLHKVRLHRQLHNYIHAVTEEFPVLDTGVMIAFVDEIDEVMRLHDTVSLRSYRDIDIPHDEKETKRHQNYLAKVATMKQGWLGIMPEIKQLSTLDPPGARACLRGIARVKGISNDKRSQKAFFSVAA